MGKYPYFPSVETTWKKKQKFDNLEISEKAVAPSNPSVNNRKLYFKNDGSLYQLDSSGVESSVGGSSGGGGGVVLAHDTDISNYTRSTTSTASSEGLGDASVVSTGAEGSNGSQYYITQNYNYYNAGTHYLDSGNPVNATSISMRIKVQCALSHWHYVKIDRITSSGTTMMFESSQINGGNLTHYINDTNQSNVIGYQAWVKASAWGSFPMYAWFKGFDATFAQTKIKSYATDSLTNTHWQSNAEISPSFSVDMGASTRTVGVSINPNSVTTETEIEIQTSDDNITFTTQRTILTSNLTNASNNFIRIAPVSCRYVKVIGTSGLSKKLGIIDFTVKKGVSDVAVIDGHEHLTIDKDDNSIGLDGV
jgi:hypothetical protein